MSFATFALVCAKTWSASTGWFSVSISNFNFSNPVHVDHIFIKCKFNDNKDLACWPKWHHSYYFAEVTFACFSIYAYVIFHFKICFIHSLQNLSPNFNLSSSHAFSYDSLTTHTQSATPPHLGHRGAGAIQNYYTSRYYQGIHGIIVVYDVTEQESLNYVKQWSNPVYVHHIFVKCKFNDKKNLACWPKKHNNS